MENNCNNFEDFRKYFSADQEKAWETLQRCIVQITQLTDAYAKEPDATKRKQIMKKMSDIGKEQMAAMDELN